LINIRGEITQNNYFREFEVKSLDYLKQIAFRLFVINLNIRKFYSTIGMYGKMKRDIEKIMGEELAPINNAISKLDKTKL